MSTLIERYEDRIAACLDCLDRVVITGTLPGICHADGMTRFLFSRKIRIFDYTEFAAPWREAIRENAEQSAADCDMEIEFVAKKHIGKEDLVQKVLARRGDHPDLVHILSAMESCTAFKPWHDKTTHATFPQRCIKVHWEISTKARRHRGTKEITSDARQHIADSTVHLR